MNSMSKSYVFKQGKKIEVKDGKVVCINDRVNGFITPQNEIVSISTRTLTLTLTRTLTPIFVISFQIVI